MNYAPSQPRGKDDEQRSDCPPAKLSLASTNKENAIASSILLLGHNTTELEVAAVNQHIALKWLSQAVVDAKTATSVLTAAGSGNWDNMIQTNTIRRLVVPIATNPQTTSVQGINRELGLYPAVAYKTFAGNGSVLTAQF